MTELPDPIRDDVSPSPLFFDYFPCLVSMFFLFFVFYVNRNIGVFDLVSACNDESILFMPYCCPVIELDSDLKLSMPYLLML